MNPNTTAILTSITIITLILVGCTAPPASNEPGSQEDQTNSEPVSIILMNRADRNLTLLVNNDSFPAPLTADLEPNGISRNQDTPLETNRVYQIFVVAQWSDESANHYSHLGNVSTDDKNVFFIYENGEVSCALGVPNGDRCWTN